MTDTYEALVSRAAVVDRSDRGSVRVTGRDAVSFTDSLVSQDITTLGDGEGAHSLLLQPQGKLTADFRMLRIGAEELWLDTDEGFGAVLAGGLNRFKIRVQVEVVDVSDDCGQLTVRGPDAATVVSDALGVAVPTQQHAHVAWRGARVVRADWPGSSGVDVVGPRHDVDDAMRALVDAGVGLAGEGALEVVRIEAGVVRQGFDVDETTIPQEAFLERDAVSFTKGCFLGQELVCRIDTRGHVNRSLRGLTLEGDVARGADVVVGEKVVGKVTSIARSPRRGVIALAMLRREVEPGAAVSAAGVAAVVQDLPFP
ncbi:MAG TPA: glycine cleavage T C-terminal barrel domain-containing protein [Acidimicrobiia bacterium]|nr:glycine cleavage T C-terminal barrel domain-containing protein [Acidimicrobiia bacterium]